VLSRMYDGAGRYLESGADWAVHLGAGRRPEGVLGSAIWGGVEDERLINWSILGRKSPRTSVYDYR